PLVVRRTSPRETREPRFRGRSAPRRRGTVRASASRPFRRARRGGATTMNVRTVGRLVGVPAILTVLLWGALGSATAFAQTPGCVPIDQNKLRLRKVGDSGTGNERILFRGMFDVDPGVTLDPVTTGLQFQMLGSAMGALIDITLPAGRFDTGGFGWLAN